MAESTQAEEGRVKEASHEKAARLHREYLEALDRMAWEKPDELVKLVCHSILCRDLDDRPWSSLPFAGSAADQDALASRRRTYSYLADLVLKRRSGATALGDVEHVTLAQWIEADVMLDEHVRPTFASPRVDHVWHEVLSEYRDNLSNSTTLATHLLYQGVPVYRRGTDGEFQLVERSNPLFHYLFTRGEAWDVVSAYDLPGWATQLYFRQEDLRWHEVMFGSLEEDDPDEIALRRNGLLKQLGLPEWSGLQTVVGGPKWPWGRHHTAHLGLLEAAARRFWVNVDPANNDTAPRNEDVVAWLRERSVSKRIAEAMATILRADGLPTGPRK